ncbi:hypothetical protein WOLCODRAFT_156732 [Wolfiporia cocos MD-104 SS10]|uniref:Uncharacterized protein n=1 Tax=Wolfiporia cocos (strain MD-104) TaxID=742152 RepID=A0A2H3J8A8_WOLCO|nr:hypothetical protein WOLCODRAFT_156732 [Wolfiporia cocos MD-104 SS10]
MEQHPSLLQTADCREVDAREQSQTPFCKERCHFAERTHVAQITSSERHGQSQAYALPEIPMIKLHRDLDPYDLIPSDVAPDLLLATAWQTISS